MLLERATELPELLQHIIEEAISMTGARYGALGVLNEERTALARFLTVGLDKEVETRTKELKTRGFVTFHGSFNYFADHFKLKILAVIEPFPGSSPTGEYIQEVLKVVQERKVPALYSEPQLDARPAKTIAEAAKIPLGTLDPVGGTPETDSYEKLLRFDVDALEKFLK